jgi:GntR family transcriptional repressor for pyruvate dehydrogenase complex
LTKVASPTRAEAVKQELIARIGQGVFAPGSRLPPERALAAELHVSRNVLREAIGSLVAMQVLATRPGVGVFVTTLDDSALLEPLELGLSVISPSLRNLMQARLVIEPGVAALASQLSAPDEVDALNRLMRESRRLIDDPQAFLDFDCEIHDAIVRMTRNPILIRVSNSIRRVTRQARELTNADPALRRRAVAAHDKILDAIAARDPHAAADAMRSHLLEVEADLFDLQIQLEPRTSH